MRILVLGAGGIGGYVGGRLAAAGADVSFLVREKRRQQLQQDGLRIESESLGNVTVAVPAWLASEVKPEYDLILLACKAYDLDSAIGTIMPVMSSGAAILPLLNGVAHVDRLNTEFGRKNVMAGTAKMGVTLTADGVVKHLNDRRTLVFGEQDGSSSGRTHALMALFEKTNIDAQISGDIMRELWMKLVQLSTVAGMVCLMRANVGEIARTPDGTALLRQLFDTHLKIAAYEGYQADDTYIASYHQLFSRTDSPDAPSMLRDIERNGPIEADHIMGFMLDKCRKHGLPELLNWVIYTHLKAYEQRRLAGRLPGQSLA